MATLPLGSEPGQALWTDHGIVEGDLGMFHEGLALQSIDSALDALGIGDAIRRHVFALVEGALSDKRDAND